MDVLRKKQDLKKLGILIGINMDEFSKDIRSIQRIRLRSKNGNIFNWFIKKLFEVKVDTAQGDKPGFVKTHLRDCIVLTSMVQSVINVHNGKGYNIFEKKPQMYGYFIVEYEIIYKKVRLG